MLRYPEQYRVQSVYGLNSFFVPFNGKTLAVCASVDTDDKGIKWEHVSVSLKHRIPTWQELKFIKMLFWDPEDEVLQLFPPQSQYIDVHKNCLHLWRPINVDLPWRKKS